ncbi:MAG: class I SAM-dependent methyltransferase [Firmicutes bacterium]|nr:class I SAM-dependent methyltransferase [Bacillota bacterium]
MAGRVCPVWLAGALEGRIRMWLQDPREVLGGFLKPGYTAVDIGCGPGFFTTAMAEMVGDEGRVIAADLQPAMLERMMAKAGRMNLASRIVPHQCQPDRLGITEKADFALAFWMVHEVPDRDGFFAEVAAMLKDSGCFLMVEPRMHVSSSGFQESVERARRAGLKMSREVKVRMSRGALFTRGQPGVLG